MIPERQIIKYKRAHDDHLNAAARDRRYDSIHTAALRAAFEGPFHAEGVAFANWMDACNAVGYQIMDEIQAGVRPPMSIAEYLAMLPPLVLPGEPA